VIVDKILVVWTAKVLLVETVVVLVLALLRVTCGKTNIDCEVKKN
jgi:hypothetical protein